jgi:hypothetical protein
LPTLDLRAGRYFDFRRDRIEVSMDIYNLTNANTVFNTRTGTGLSNIRVNGDANNPITQIPTFLSPTQFLAPRVLRFNVTYSFNRR